MAYGSTARLWKAMDNDDLPTIQSILTDTAVYSTMSLVSMQCNETIADTADRWVAARRTDDAEINDLIRRSLTEVPPLMNVGYVA